MKSLKDLKQRYIDHLYSLDLKRMDVAALNIFGYILKTLDDMEKPSYQEMLAKMTDSFGRKPEKEEKKDG